VKARWLGHRLHADVTIGVDPGASLGEALAIADELLG
jgi:divalent metal cation (Fe/Co/Zn/Cd) transporter